MNKILIVDDDQEFIAAFSTFLTGHGFAVLKAYDATLALKFARKEAIDLMVLDLGLPAGGGQFVLTELRQTLSILRGFIFVTHWYHYMLIPKSAL